MWEPEGELIQIEAGTEIVQQGTLPDERGMLGRMLGEDPPPRGSLLVKAIDDLRQPLYQETGINLPFIAYRQSQEIGPDEVIIYWGLQVFRFRLERASQLIEWIANSHRSVSVLPWDRASLRKLLGDAIEAVRGEDFQDAYDRYCLLYYLSSIYSQEFELVCALADAGSIMLRNTDYARGLPCLLRAAKISQSPNVAAPNLKAQVCINAGNALKSCGQHADALGQFEKAFDIASSCGDPSLLLLTLTAGSESLCAIGSYGSALTSLEKARALILSQPSPEYRAAFNVERCIGEIYRGIYSKATKAQQTEEHRSSLSPIFDELKHLVVSMLTQSVIGAIVFKVFGVQSGSLLSIFGTSEYNIQSSVFNASAVGNGARVLSGS